MSTNSRGSGGGNGILAGSRKMVQSLKEIVNCPEAEIYATLKDCNIDPNEAVNRLLSQDPFHEEKSKREKKKEVKDTTESRPRGVNNSFNRGGNSGSDRYLGRGGSTPYYSSESTTLHGRPTYKKENESNPYTSSLSSAPGIVETNKSRRLPNLSDGFSAENKESQWDTSDGILSGAQPPSAYQSAWAGVPGQVSMDDIVKMGKPHNKAVNAPNASHNNVQYSSTTTAHHNSRFPNDHDSNFHEFGVSQQVPIIDEWPSIEKPTASTVTSIFTLQFWRMAVLWTISLIFSHLKLFSKTFLSPKSKFSPQNRSFTSSSMAMPVCIITGATSGLGAAAAHALSNEGFFVVIVGRSSERLSKAISDVKSRNNDACIKAFQVDLSSLKSIVIFKSSLEQWLLDSNMHSSVQLLINNAGILATSRRLTSEGYDQMMATNYIGAFCLTKILLPLLENSPVPSRVVNVSSFTHWNVCCRQVDKETVSGKRFMISNCYPYAQIYEYSKLCLLLFSYELHRQFQLMEKSHHLSVVVVDPGAVKTNIMREIPSCISQSAYIVLKLLGLLQSPEIGVRSILDASLASPEVSGVYFFGGNGTTLNSSALSYDSKLAKDLWATSCILFNELQQHY